MQEDSNIHQLGVTGQGGREVLVFGMAGEEYAIGIEMVQEIRGYDAVTRLANMPDYMKGVVNLRGVIVPLLDLRIRFGLPNPVYDATTVVIILNLDGRQAGVIVDRVADVLQLSADQLKPAPTLTGVIAADHVLGLGTVDDRMLILVDIGALLADCGVAQRQPLAA